MSYNETRQDRLNDPSPSLFQDNRTTAQLQVVQLVGGGDEVKTLKDLLTSFDSDISLGFFNVRPQLLKDAYTIVTEVKNKNHDNIDVQLRLIDLGKKLNSWMNGVDTKGLSGDKKKRYDAVKKLRDEIHSKLGTSSDIANSVQDQSRDVEHAASAEKFSDYFIRKYPNMVVMNEDGEPKLKDREAIRTFESAQSTWNSLQNGKRPKIRAIESHMSTDEKWIQKIIDNTYPQYQGPLRKTGTDQFTNSFDEKQKLLEGSKIVGSFAKFDPEVVTETRFASAFPSGITDASTLVVNNVYTESGFLFVGGERPADDGFKMRITLTKGYPVDARGYYGHRSDNEEKMQWISLPGASFKYLGVDDGPVYKFEQISR